MRSIMEIVPDKKEQQKLIEEEMKKMISDNCFLISTEWWENWRLFVGSKESPPPGPIDNSNLVMFLEEYRRSFEKIVDLKKLSDFDNWCKMCLRKELEEYTHFQVLSVSCWLKLNNWYGGGPTIRICVVGNDKISPIYKIGFPDFDPIVLRIELSHSRSANKIIKGILFSEKATCEKLFSYLGELFNICPTNLMVRLQPYDKGAFTEVKKTSKTLLESGIYGNTKLVISDRVEPVATTRERKWWTSNSNSYIPARTDTDMTEDEMIQMAIQKSKEEMKKEDFDNNVWEAKENGSKTSPLSMYETYQLQLSSPLSPESETQKEFQTVYSITSKAFPSLSLSSKSLCSILSNMEKIEASFK